MKANTSKSISFYTQGKQFTARALFIVWLLASGSPESALATPKRQMVPATPTSPGDPSLASAPPTPGGILPSQSTGLPLDAIEETEELPVHEDPLEIVQNMINAARDEQWSDRKAALKKLTQVVLNTPLKMQTILPILTQAAKDQDYNTRLVALRAFASLAPVASSAAGTILQILTQAAHKDQDYDTRLVVLEALAKITIAAPSEASDDSMEVLEAAAKDQEEYIREIVLEALSRVPRAASSEITDTTTVPEDTAYQQALYSEKLLELRAARKPVLSRPEPEVQQEVPFSAEERVQALLVFKKTLEARYEQELTQLAAESVKAESQEQKAPHTQELGPLATGKLVAEPQQALHEEQEQLLSAQKDSKIQELEHALERVQSENQALKRKLEALLSANEQLRSAQGQKPE